MHLFRLTLSSLALISLFSPTRLTFAADAAQVVGNLQVDGLWFSNDSNRTLLTKPADFQFPWTYSDPHVYFGINSGNVGIGTLSPTDKLDVAGNLKITGNLKLPQTTATTGQIFVGSARIHSFGTQNIFVGSNAGNLTMSGEGNSVIGIASLTKNTTGSHNTANGNFSLNNNTIGSWNTAHGAQALYSNISGSENTAVGYQALYSNNPTASLDGIGNTAVGESSLYSNVTGSFNTAIGSRGLNSNTSGASNSAVGYLALLSNTTGYDNTAIGFASLSQNTTGILNTALGAGAGYGTLANANITGSRNTFIGASSGPGTTTQLSNATAIGHLARVSQSNSLVLGGTGSAAVKVGIGTESPTETLDVIGNIRLNDKDIFLRSGADTYHGLGFYGASKTFAGIDVNGPALFGYGGGVLGTNSGTQKIMMKWDSGLFDFYGYARFRVLSSGSTYACLDANNSISTCSSDLRLKKDVAALGDSMDVLAALSKLRGVSFTWDKSNERSSGMPDGRDMGMIAQEVEQVFPEIVHTDKDGYKSLDYPKLVAFLIEAGKAQQAQLNAQKQEFTRLFEDMNRRLAALEATKP